MRTWSLLLCLAVACAPSEDDAPGTGTDTDPAGVDDTDPTDDTDPLLGETDAPEETDVACTAQLVSTTPADGEPDALADGELTVVFTSDERTTAQAELTVTSTGDVVPLEAPAFTAFGRVLTLTPVDPLGVDTGYTLAITFSCGADAVAFTTTDLGEPVDPVDVEGRTFAIDPSTLSMTEPVGAASWITRLVGTPSTSAALAVIALDEGSGTAELEAGMVELNGTTWEQDTCRPTLLLDGDYASAPEWSVQTPMLPLDLGGSQVDLTEVDVSGMFAPHGDFIGHLRISGVFDTRPISTALLGGKPQALCNGLALIPNGNASCIPCVDQPTGASCLRITLEDGRAFPTAPFELATVTPGDVAVDPACATP